MKVKDFFEKYDEYQVKIALSYVLEQSYGMLRSNMDMEVGKDVEDKIAAIFSKINDGLPIQYAIGYWDFYGRTFTVNPSVLIPRSETELLCQLILNEDLKDKKILDIGTGSGAIAITLKLENPSLIVTASDISNEALQVAKENANKLSAEIKFIESDLFENIDERFDLIVSNPPYISQEDYDKLDEKLYREPQGALLAGPKGYEIYARIIENAKDHLYDEGKIFFEIGYDQGAIVKELLHESGFTGIKVHKDYNQIDRMVEAIFYK